MTILLVQFTIQPQVLYLLLFTKAYGTCIRIRKLGSMYSDKIDI